VVEPAGTVLLRDAVVSLRIGVISTKLG